MTRCVAGASRLAILLSVCAVAPPATAGEDSRKWWQSDRVKTEIGLTAEQSRQLEDVFQTMLPRMRAEKEELDREERAVSRLMTDATAAEADVTQAIDRVEALRARAGKTRLLMLYRMYRVLTPEQRQKLQVMHDKRERRRHEGGNTRPQ
jgi:Spy/CpxP family protein refolding chaperone